MNRTYEIKVRFNKEELQSLYKKVEKTGMSREQYIRTLCKNKVPVEIPPIDYFSLIREVRELGNNMYQIAYKVNSMGLLDTPFYRQNAETITELADKLTAVCLPIDSV